MRGFSAPQTVRPVIRWCRGALAAILITLAGLASAAAQPQPSPELLAKYEAAQAAFGQGRFEEAATHYQALVEALPTVAGLKMNWGMALYLSGRPAEAVAPLREAVTGDTNLAPAWLFLGISLLETGRPAEAVPPLKEYVRVNPDEGKGFETLGDALLQTDAFAEAAVRYRRAVEIDPKSAQGWYGLGRAYEALAGQKFATLNEKAPESAYWLSLIGESRLTQKQYASAFFFFREALARDPGLRGAHASIARIYRETERGDWADQEEAKELALGQPDCAKERLFCLFIEGKFAEVLEDKAGAEDPAAWFWQIKAGNQLAIQAFTQLEALPPSPEAYLFRAENERNLNRHWESVALLRRALELAPGHPVVQRELALSMYLQRDYDDARKLVHELLEVEPDSPVLNFLAGDIRLYQQEVEDGIKFLEKAARLNPEHIGAHSALGRAYMQIGAVEKAIPHLKAALPEDEDGSLLFQLARAYQRTGQGDLARQTMAEYQSVRQKLQEQQRATEERLVITPP